MFSGQNTAKLHIAKFSPGFYQYFFPRFFLLIAS